MNLVDVLRYVRSFPRVEAGSVIVLRMSSSDHGVVETLLKGLKRHYGHEDFLVVVLGLHESIDVIPADEVLAWAGSRRGYFGGAGGHYLEET